MLLQKGANTNVVLENTKSLLVMSCKLNHPDIVDLLLQYNADVNYCHYSGETALYFAFEDGNIDIIRRLLNNHADWKVCKHERDFFLIIKSKSKSTFDKLTPLHLAITNGHDKIVRLLIEGNANVNATTASGENALFLACSYSHDNVLSVLYELKTYDMIIQFGHINTSHLEQFYMPMRSVLKEILCCFQVGYSVNSIDTVIHSACRMEDEELLNSLIIANANVNSINAFGETPLLIAVSKPNLNIVLILLDVKAPINVSCTVHGQGVENLLGKTSIKKMENVLPIHLACLLDNF
ncbi:ANK [Mytilus coruscus]|uniref:ANK n=1 Tax=Mytilus coruscus TaxID=42192 RepID=A0A6J8DAM1_MYTCO|nr:ANK [Mytilus coruscus]